MSMIECNKTNCRNNYEGECLEVALSRLKISAHGTCCNYLPSDLPSLNKIRKRITRLHESVERDLLKAEDDSERLVYQSQINVIEVIYRIFDEEENK